VQVRVDVTREQIASLERLGLFDADAGTSSLAWAVGLATNTGYKAEASR
jgi:hypothetical protein